MNIKQYTDVNDRRGHFVEALNRCDGFTSEEIKKGIHTLYQDVTCSWCGKEQAVSMTGYVGGPCVSCGGRTDGSDDRKSPKFTSLKETIETK